MGTLLLVILDAMVGIPLGWLFLVATLAGLDYPLQVRLRAGAGAAGCDSNSATR